VANFSFHFGRRALVNVSLFLFTLGSIVCCVASNFATLLGGRVVQGVGGGGIITLAQVIFCDIVPLRQRPRHFAQVQAAWAIGTLVGPVIGGLFAERDWRWIFYINFPFCALGFICVNFFFRLQTKDPITLLEQIARVDWIGAILFTGGLTSFLVGLSWGGVQFGWVTVATLAPILLGLTALVAFAIWQCKKKGSALLPVSLFHCNSAYMAYFASFCHGVVVSLSSSLLRVNALKNG
jgi:MFS family permease